MKKIINFYKRLTFLQGAAVAGSLTSVIAVATTVSGLHSFTSGTVISSTQVNDNFTLLKNAVESTASQTYIGTYNANTGVTPTAGSNGDYYVITTAGTIGGVTYNVGDWIIFNGTIWGRIPSTSLITSVFGRTGVIAPAPGDYNFQLLGDYDSSIAAVNGDVLKYNSSTQKWGPSASTTAVAETDPTVQAFAKTNLPSCSAGQVLKSVGNAFSCVTDAGAPAFSGAIAKAVITGAAGALETSSVSSTELSYLSGATSNIQAQIIANTTVAGTTAQYFRGDKTWQDLNPKILTTTLTGLAPSGGTVTAADTFLLGFNKLVYAQTDAVSKTAASTVTGNITVSGAGYITLPSPINMTDAVNKSYVDNLLQYVKVNSTLTSVGVGSGNPAGANNAFYGTSAGAATTTGTSNTFIGAVSGFSNTSGPSNTAIGNSSLYSVTTGSNNTGLGRSAGANITTGINNTAVGAIAGGLSGDNNVTIGYSSGFNVNGSGNVFIGGKLFSSATTLNNTIILSTGGDGTTSTERVRIDSIGNMGLGTTTPAYKLDVVGDINASSSVRANSVSLTSDKRLKKNISTITNALEKILGLRGVEFDWKTDGTHEIGVVAQEVEKVVPTFVVTDAKGMKSVKYANMSALLIESTKEMNKKVESLEAENKMLKAYLCEQDPNAPFCRH